MNDSVPSGHLALITGGTSGLGLACAKAMLKESAPAWRLIIASRDRLAGAKAVVELNRHAGRDAAEFVQLDLGDLNSVQRFVSATHARDLCLDAVICNAGLQFTAETRTAQGFEASFGVNHLGHYALVTALGRSLQAQARVLVVSSGTHDPLKRTGIPAPRWVEPRFLAQPELDPLHGFEGSDALRTVMQRRYSTSKLCNLYFAYELDRRIRAGTIELSPGITVNAFDPGLMPGTGLVRDYPAPLRFVWHRLLPALRPLLRRVMGGNVHTPAQSGAALADLVVSPRWAGVSGRYFEGRHEIASSDESHDQTRADSLWTASAAMVAAAR